VKVVKIKSHITFHSRITIFLFLQDYLEVFSCMLMYMNDWKKVNSNNLKVLNPLSSMFSFWLILEVGQIVVSLFKGSTTIFLLKKLHGIYILLLWWCIWITENSDFLQLWVLNQNTKLSCVLFQWRFIKSYTNCIWLLLGWVEVCQISTNSILHSKAITKLQLSFLLISYVMHLCEFMKQLDVHYFDVVNPKVILSYLLFLCWRFVKNKY